MNLHEYQAKNLFKEYGISTTNGRLLTNHSQIDDILDYMGDEKCVIKAQIHAGGRGKAGGVVLVDGKKEAKETVNKLLGSKLVTNQTTKSGQPVNSLYIEPLCEIERQLYLAFVVDRVSQRVMIITSPDGGMEIEEVAANNPKRIFKNKINPVVGIMSYQCRQIAFDLGLESDKQVKQMIDLLQNMYKLFLEKDLTLIEVNPLVVTKQGDLICLDAKVQVDSNALYRQTSLNEIRDESQDDYKEIQAEKLDLNYVALDGNIGCMVNGAGLAMATMDLIKTYGGEPANFLDVGGTTNEQRVIEAIRIILSDRKVNGILINIFGGIVRCDIIASGIIAALSKMEVDIPIVVRLEGNSAKEGLELIKNSGLNIIEENDLDIATKKIIELTKGK